MVDDCSQNSDPLKLVREGTSQVDRDAAALDPAFAPVNARTVADGIVFAQGYSRLLRHYDANNAQAGNWEPSFGAGAAVPLAVAAIEDPAAYATAVRAWFDFLNDLGNAKDAAALKDRLGYLYAAAGVLAQALDGLGQSLPDTVTLKGTLRNLVKTQLAPAFARLVGYYKGGVGLNVVNKVAPAPALWVLRRKAASFDDVLAAGLAPDWTEGKPWAAYLGAILPDDSVYGAGGAPDPFLRINHCTTHNLFRSIFDQFLKVFMRVVSEAQAGLADTLDNFSGQAPHYALFLAFLQLLEHARTAANTLTQRHLDFYYSTVLGLKKKPAQPGYVHLLAELAKQAESFRFAPGQRFKAGKDAAGKPAFFANIADFVANKAAVAAMKTIYRHGNEPITSGAIHQGRIFASPVADSDDGQGAPMASSDHSWHPFFNKVYVDGALVQIRMPEAAIGFAIASHYLLAAEGTRNITVSFTTSGPVPQAARHDFTEDVTCLLTSAKGWIAKTPSRFADTGSNVLELALDLTGADDAVVPYSAKVHGYNFDTSLPLLLVVLRQDDSRAYAYARLEDVTLSTIDVTVEVSGVRTLAVSNDFGPVDAGRPFQPFGPSPVKGSSLVIGSKEIFQKQLTHAQVDLKWQVPPKVFQAPQAASALQPLIDAIVANFPFMDGTAPNASVDVLKAGAWYPTNFGQQSIAPNNGGGDPDTTRFDLGSANDSVVDVPDFSPDEPYGTQARHGYARFRLDGDIGQDAYQQALIDFVRSKPGETDHPGPPPQGPVAGSLTMNYTATSTLVLGSAASKAQFETRGGRFFHLAPFGTAEQHSWLSGASGVSLLPQFRVEGGSTAGASEAEFYIGVTGLTPPQNLSLLFQVLDGSANPLAQKQGALLDWSYLAHDRWIRFPENAVIDSSGELLYPGIVTLAVPGDATSDNRLLPSGMFWVRVAVHEASDAVGRLQLVAAQATKAVFSDQDNAPGFSSTPLPPGTITQLATPDTAVKAISQPYPSFGGRGAEGPREFYRRVSERLRHKDRALDLWDYEHLILEAFPQIYKVKCLNHTCYEPAGAAGACGGIYRELAAGHVTIVTLPNLAMQQQRDPLKPYTSLGLLEDIRAFLQQRTSCFAQLHVKNPQFEEVWVRFKLKFIDGYDRAYYTTQLQQAITRFLSPWAFSGAVMPSFGGKIYKSALIHFVESQPYVDYVTDFQLFQNIPCQPPGTVDFDEVTASRAVSILVSAPASKHQISVIEAAPDQALAETCGCGA